MHMEGDIYKQFSVRPNGRRTLVPTQSTYYPSVIPSGVLQYEPWRPAGIGSPHVAQTIGGNVTNQSFSFQNRPISSRPWNVIQDTGMRPALPISQRQTSLNINQQRISSSHCSVSSQNVSLNCYQLPTFVQRANSDSLKETKVLQGGSGRMPNPSLYGTASQSNTTVVPYGFLPSGVPFNCQPVVSQGTQQRIIQVQLPAKSGTNVSGVMSTVPPFSSSSISSSCIQVVPVHAPSQRADQLTILPGTVCGMPGSWPSVMHTSSSDVKSSQLTAVNRTQNVPVVKIEPNCDAVRVCSQVTSGVQSILSYSVVSSDNRPISLLGLASIGNQLSSQLVYVRQPIQLPINLTLPVSQMSSSSCPDRQVLKSDSLRAGEAPTSTKSRERHRHKRSLSPADSKSSCSSVDAEITKCDSREVHHSGYSLRSRKMLKLPKFVSDKNDIGSYDDEVSEHDDQELNDDDTDTDPTWENKGCVSDSSKTSLSHQSSRVDVPRLPDNDMESDIEADISVDRESVPVVKTSTSLLEKITNYEDVSETDNDLAFVMECYDDSDDVPAVTSKKVSQPVSKVHVSTPSDKFKNIVNNSSSKVSNSMHGKLLNSLLGKVATHSVAVNVDSSVQKPRSCSNLATDEVMIIDAVPSTKSSVPLLIASKNSKSVLSNRCSTDIESTSNKVCKAQNVPNNMVLSKASLNCSANKYTGVHLQLLFFRLEEDSATLYRLIGWQRTESDNTVTESKTQQLLYFQCVFCPFVDTSTRRIAAHVKIRHSELTFALAKRAVSSKSPLMFLFCRHCNFVSHDEVVMLLHFHTFHSLSHIVSDSAFCPNTAAAEAGRLNPNALANVFPYYCCTSCNFMSLRRVHATDHVATEHASKFANCFVSLVMVGRPSSVTTESFLERASSMQFVTLRKVIFACVRCSYFSFCSFDTLSHNLNCHRASCMVYVCDVVEPLCNKRFSNSTEAVRHLQLAHRNGLLFGKNLPKISVTLVNMVGMMPVEYFFAPGKINEEDLPTEAVVRRQVTGDLSLLTASKVIEIDDDDDDDDVLIIDNVQTPLSDLTQLASKIDSVSNEGNVNICSEGSSIGVCVAINMPENDVASDNNAVCSVSAPEKKLDTVSISSGTLLDSSLADCASASELSVDSDRVVDIPDNSIENNCGIVFENFRDEREISCFNIPEQSNSTAACDVVHPILDYQTGYLSSVDDTDTLADRDSAVNLNVLEAAPHSVEEHQETVVESLDAVSLTTSSGHSTNVCVTEVQTECDSSISLNDMETMQTNIELQNVDLGDKERQVTNATNEPSLDAVLLTKVSGHLSNVDLACVTEVQTECGSSVGLHVFEETPTNIEVQSVDLETVRLDTKDTEITSMEAELTNTASSCISCADLASHCVWANVDDLDVSDDFQSTVDCESILSDSCGIMNTLQMCVVNAESFFSKSNSTNEKNSISMCSLEQTLHISDSSQCSAVDDGEVVSDSLPNRSKFKRLASYRFMQSKAVEEVTVDNSNENVTTSTSFNGQNSCITAEQLSQLNELP